MSFVSTRMAGVLAAARLAVIPLAAASPQLLRERPPPAPSRCSIFCDVVCRLGWASELATACIPWTTSTAAGHSQNVGRGGGGAANGHPRPVVLLASVGWASGSAGRQGRRDSPRDRCRAQSVIEVAGRLTRGCRRRISAGRGPIPRGSSRSWMSSKRRKVRRISSSPRRVAGAESMSFRRDVLGGVHSQDGCSPITDSL
jgi:hypothetical protein